MSKSTTDNAVAGEKEIYLPLEPLLTLLRNKGFLIKPDDYIEMLKVVERFGSTDIDDTAKWICPIIASSEGEQANFYKVVEEYKRLSGYTAPTRKKHHRFPVWLKGLAILLLVAAVFALFHTVKKSSADLSLPPYSAQRVLAGDTVTFDASNDVSSLTKITKDINLTWKFNSDKSEQGLTVKHVFDSQGVYTVSRKLINGNSSSQEFADSFLVQVCEHVPTVILKGPDETLTTGKTFTFHAEAVSNGKKKLNYEWRLQDSVFKTADSFATFKFTKAGYYTVECTVSTEGLADYCTAADAGVFHVTDPGINYEVAVIGAGKAYPLKSEPKRWLSLLLLVPAVTGLLYSLFKGKLNNKKKAEDKKEINADAVKKKRATHQVPFENNDMKLVKQEKAVRGFFLQMRQRAEEETLELSIGKTITSTIRSGGMPTLVYAPCQQKQSYLVLIDQSNPKSMMTHLFDYLVNSLADANIPVDKFYYNQQFTCFNHEYKTGISLQRLADIHCSSSLIIFGKAHELVYRAYPVIEEHLLKELNKWENKAIITPVAFADWGEKERVLSNYTLLLPADVQGLQKLVPAMKEKVKSQRSFLKANFTGQEQTTYIDFKDADELYEYLNDKVVFQWLCAACIYPKLRWEILVEVGKTILDKYHQADKLNYTLLLKLCRISWMQDGVFPQSIRLELLKRLEVDNEVAARETILRMLEYVNLFYGEDNSFDDEINLQKLSNKFVLYANDQTKYIQYADSREQFEKLYINKSILDAPFKRYLDKANNEDYTTPLNNQHSSVSLGDYFSLQQPLPKKAIFNKRFAVAACSIFLIALWSTIYLSGATIKLGGLSFTKVRSNQTIPLTMKVGFDISSCDSSSKKFDLLTGSLLVGGNPVNLTYNAGNSTATADIPYSPEDTGIATLQLNLTPEETVQTPFRFNNASLPDSITIICKNTPAPVDSIETNADSIGSPVSTKLPVSLNEIWYGVTNNRLININLAQNIIYYSTGPVNSYGTYRIVEVYRQPNGLYKIITQLNQTFRAFYVSKITSQSFELSVCQTPYKTKEELLKIDESSCDPFYQMELYGATNDADKIFLPVYQSGLGNRRINSQRQKLVAKSSLVKNPKLRSKFTFTYYHSSFINTTPLSVINQQIKSVGFDPFEVRNGKSSGKPNPFQRDYLTLAVMGVPNDAPTTSNNDVLPNDPPPNVQQSSTTLITAGQLTQIVNNKGNAVDEFAKEFNRQFPTYNLTTENRMAAFISQVAYETGSFRYLQEQSLNISADMIMKIYSSKFKRIKEAYEYANNPERLANFVYANRLGNGNEASGDGYKYRGRGLFMFTGKSNYALITKLTGIDFITYPDYMSQPAYATTAALAWWNNSGFNTFADREDIEGLTKKISGNTTRIAERNTIYSTAKKVLNSSQSKATKD